MDLEVGLDAVPGVASAAREALEPIRRSVDPGVYDDLRLIVSELVTNSYRHGGLGPDEKIVLRLQLEGPSLHLEVWDRGRFKRKLDEDSESGWGLKIVERLARRWGIRDEDGTLVWLDMNRRREAAHHHIERAC